MKKQYTLFLALILSFGAFAQNPQSSKKYWNTKNWSGTWYDQGTSLNSPMDGEGSFIGSTEVTQSPDNVYTLMNSQGIWKNEKTEATFSFSESRIYTRQDNILKGWIFPSDGKVVSLEGRIDESSPTIELVDSENVYRQTITYINDNETEFFIEFKPPGAPQWMRIFTGTSRKWNKNNFPQNSDVSIQDCQINCMSNCLPNEPYCSICEPYYSN